MKGDPLRILVCPTAFKGTLTADEASRAMARGALRGVRGAEVIRRPLSDGGPGLLDALLGAPASSDGEHAAADPGAESPEARFDDEEVRIDEVLVSGPLGNPVLGRVLWTSESGGEVATFESADACGVDLLPRSRRDPMRSDTRGVGELIRYAEERGARTVRIGLGGSGTVDGGTGAARVYGWRFLDDAGRELPPGGGALTRLGRIASGARPEVGVTALADVESPLNGMAGAARRFGPQKGATGEQLERLVEGLERLAERLEEDLGVGKVADLPGSGAAGGLGAGLVAFLGAAIEPGSDWVLERVGFRQQLSRSDLVVTGEGAFDASSLAGKIVGRVVELAREAGVPTLLLCGRFQGEPPEGTRAADGGGERLESDDLEDLAARETAAAAEI
ncbi:MAG: glycerate kinase [Gemmatimonadota bacterium]